MKKYLWQRIHQSWFLVVFCVGIIVGCILALILRIQFFNSTLWSVFVGLVLVFVYLSPRRIFLTIAILAGIILSFYRTSNELQGEDYIKQFYNQEIVVAGVVDGDPETDEKGTKIRLKNLKFGEDGGHKTRGNIYILLQKNERIKRSDELKLRGKMLEGFGTYAGFLYKPSVMNIARPEPGDLIIKVRDWFAERIIGLIPEPEVNLGLSYLLGMKSGLPDDLSEDLRTVGLVHIVVASGAHLSILVGIARKIFGKVSRFFGLLVSVIFVLFFMSMVGFTPSILRAGVMSILTLLAWYVGRKFAPWRIILIVMAFTLILNPMFVVNLGWLLSFASFAGIMILGPKISEFFYGDREPKFIASMIIVTLSATLMTLPIILYFYGSISLISVAANLLILPTLPYAMGLVFLSGVVYGVPGIETFVAFLATKMLDFHILVVDFFGQQKNFMVEIEPEQPGVFLIYLLIVLPLMIGLIRQKMLKSRQVKNNFKREKLCQDIANGPLPNVRKL